MKVIVIRSGSAILFSEFGERPVTVGDVVVLGENVLCGSEPEEYVTTTTMYLDTEYIIDQVFWQHAELLLDRLDAQDFAETIYTEPAQILRLGESAVGQLLPWLDELVYLSGEGKPIEHFYRMQALWFSVAHIVAPYIETSLTRTSPTQRVTTWPTDPRHRRFSPLRAEARKAADLLRQAPDHRWMIDELATQVHLSRSQLRRIFVEAYGKSPIAYLTMLRTEKMAALLRTTDAPIAVIAHEVGWHDPDFAARQFRRNIGIPPSRYRALSRGWAAQAPR